MATLPMNASAEVRGSEASSAQWWGVPWFVWVSAGSIFCATFGLYYDESWHRSIGRDGFWNPSHMVLYMSGILSAVYCGYLMVATTWGKDQALRRHSVRIAGVRAPIGVFLAAWGGLSMLYDASFDNWWHNAYGLDVRFASPPHLLFSISLFFEMLGGLVLACSYLNRAKETPGSVGFERFDAVRLQWVVLCMGAGLVLSLLIVCSAYTWDTRLHDAKAYISVGLVLPLMLAMMAAVTGRRWSCTIVTAIYTAFLITLILVMPLFPATPRLGPIYVPVTHFIPPRFPLLVLVPAVALDLLWQRVKLRGVVTAVVSGAMFTALLVAVEWPFADFLVSGASANRFFGTRYLGFSDVSSVPGPGAWAFVMPQHGAHLAAGLAVAAACAAVGVYVGAALGREIRGIRR